MKKILFMTKRTSGSFENCTVRFSDGYCITEANTVCQSYSFVILKSKILHHRKISLSIVKALNLTVFFVQDAVLGVETDRGSNGGGQGKSRYLPPHLRGKPGDIFISILQSQLPHKSQIS
jgi:hypothetical protein